MQAQRRAAVAVVDDLDLAQVDGRQRGRPAGAGARPGLQDASLAA